MAGSSVGRKVCETAQKFRKTVTNTIKARREQLKQVLIKQKTL